MPLLTQSDVEYLIQLIQKYQGGWDVSPAGMISKHEWDSIWAKFPAEGLRDKIWEITPGDPMAVENLITVLENNDAINDQDLDFFKEEVPSPDGMISYDDWKAIWEKSEMLALADKIWYMTPGDPKTIEDLIKAFL